MSEENVDATATPLTVEERLDRVEKAVADLSAPHELTARVEKIEDEIRARFTTAL